MFCRLGFTDESRPVADPGHVERGVQPPGAGVQQRRQRVNIGRLQLGELAVVEHHARNFVLAGQPLQHIHRGRNGLALAILDRLGQVQLVEQHVAQLLGRIDVELEARLVVDLARLGLDLALQPLRHFRQHIAIELDAGLFHARQHRHQRQIDLVVNLAQPGWFDFVAQFFA